MKDEIKEILDYLKNDDYSPVFSDEGCDDTPYKLFEECEIKVLLDYIINLQQENERLKVYLKPEFIVNKIKQLEEENKDLKLQLRGTTHCYDEHEHRALKECIKQLQEQIAKFGNKRDDDK